MNLLKCFCGTFIMVCCILGSIVGLYFPLKIPKNRQNIRQWFLRPQTLCNKEQWSLREGTNEVNPTITCLTTFRVRATWSWVKEPEGPGKPGLLESRTEYRTGESCTDGEFQRCPKSPLEYSAKCMCMRKSPKARERTIQKGLTVLNRHTRCQLPPARMRNVMICRALCRVH